MELEHQVKLAYLIGVALGDGDLSNPNGRAIRLRISCFSGYPKVAKEITDTIRFLLPRNKVSVICKTGARCFDISVYSDTLAGWMPWTAGKGSKIAQKARVPRWIFEDISYMQACLRGLIQTDGCVYTDRGYRMINFVNVSRELTQDVHDMLSLLGYRPKLRTNKNGESIKHWVRIARKEEAARLIQELDLRKA